MQTNIKGVTNMQTNKNLIPSGLHNTPFYTLETKGADIDFELVNSDLDLARQYLFNPEDFDHYDDEDIEDVVRNELYDQISIYNTLYKVEEHSYNEETAYKCSLVPFKITEQYEEDKHYLALGGCGMDLSPRLDAYYFLQTGNMDPLSTYFTDKEFFKSLVSDEIFNAIETKFGGVKWIL